MFAASGSTPSLRLPRIVRELVAGLRFPRFLRMVPPALILILFVGTPLAAQGWIEPLRPSPGWGVERTGSQVRVTVDGRVAQVEVTEWFRNRGSTIAEGQYLHPLAGEATFGSFSLFQGDEELVGETLDADDARRTYEGIVARLRDPALIELAGEGMIRARVFPFQPGETRRVVLRYEQVLSGGDGSLRFLYTAGHPLQGGALPGRPHPGDTPGPADVRDGPETDRPSGPAFELVVNDPDAFLDPFSPTHHVEVERERRRIVVRSQEPVEGRLSLFLPLAAERVGLSVATHRLSGEDGWVMLALSPGRVEPDASEPRDVTVVLDVSGSMSGAKMEQARAALQQLLGTLDSRDRFRLVAYNAAVRSFREEWAEARGPELEAARRWVEALGATGGTNISAALDEAFKLDSPAGRLPLVVFLTDGLPTVGEEDPDRIATAAEAKRGRSRVFAFGVGYDVNTRLLDTVALAGRGTTAYVQPGESVETALGTLAEKIRHPVLTDLELMDAPVRIHELHPVTIPDLFAGEELLLLARYTPGHRDLTGNVILRGIRGGRTETYHVRTTFPLEQTADAWLPRLWASRKVGHLSRQIRIEGESKALVEEIRALALRYGLVSEYTSYLVTEPGTAMAEGPPSFGRVRGGSAVPAGQAFPREQMSGAAAVRSAEAARLFRDAGSAADLKAAEARVAEWAPAATSDVRVVAGRTYVEVDGAWQDVGVSEDVRRVRVAPYSRAWFGLLEALPELRGPASSFGEVVVAGMLVTVELVDGGVESLSAEELAAIVADFRGR